MRLEMLGPRLRRGVKLLGLLMALLGGLYLLRRPLLVSVAELTTVDDPRARSDYLFLLNGEPNVRPFYAAQLYHSGLAPRILFSAVETLPTEELGLVPRQTDVAHAVLRRLGVPDSAIVIIPFAGGATSTRDEARALRAYLQSHPALRVTVITSMHHSGRSKFTIAREMRGIPVEIRMAAAPHPKYSTRNWWQVERGISDYGMEYLKWIHTLTR